MFLQKSSAGRVCNMAEEPLVFQKCGKEKCHRLPLHIVLKQHPDRGGNLLAADPLKELILVLKMIIESHPDYTGAIRDLFDRDFLNRFLKNKLLKAVRKKDLYFRFCCNDVFPRVILLQYCLLCF